MQGLADRVMLILASKVRDIATVEWGVANRSQGLVIARVGQQKWKLGRPKTEGVCLFLQRQESFSKSSFALDLAAYDRSLVLGC